MPDKDGNTVCPRCEEVVHADELVTIDIDGETYVICRTFCKDSVERFLESA